MTFDEPGQALTEVALTVGAVLHPGYGAAITAAVFAAIACCVRQLRGTAGHTVEDMAERRAAVANAPPGTGRAERGRASAPGCVQWSPRQEHCSS